jgi:carboxymethylenebutenolidase
MITRCVLAVLLASSPLLGAEEPRKRLEGSQRHFEWVVVKSGDRSVRSFIVYPETKGKATAVLLIHENKGLTDWVRATADKLAQAGFLVIAPDLLTGLAPGGGDTSDFPSIDAATKALYARPGAEVLADLGAVADHAVGLPAASGKLAVAGFCWGGSQTFRFAAARGKDVRASFVFYGTGPTEREALSGVSGSVYGFYGGNDARVTATVPATTALMKELGKTYEPETYEGAGHGFMRTAEAPDASEADRKAARAAWDRWIRLLRGL